LGYRDLENFNFALLAKQGWRLPQNPQSLVARVIKEKYHSGCSFMEYELGNRPSYAWCSIWNSKKLLKKGLIWRVRMGIQFRYGKIPGYQYLRVLRFKHR
jgi:hypothetical protein